MKVALLSNTHARGTGVPVPLGHPMISLPLSASDLIVPGQRVGLDPESSNRRSDRWVYAYNKAVNLSRDKMSTSRKSASYPLRAETVIQEDGRKQEAEGEAGLELIDDMSWSETLLVRVGKSQVEAELIERSLGQQLSPTGEGFRVEELFSREAVHGFDPPRPRHSSKPPRCPGETSLATHQVRISYSLWNPDSPVFPFQQLWPLRWKSICRALRKGWLKRSKHASGIRAPPLGSNPAMAGPHKTGTHRLVVERTHGGSSRYPTWSPEFWLPSRLGCTLQGVDDSHYIFPVFFGAMRLMTPE